MVGGGSGFGGGLLLLLKDLDAGVVEDEACGGGRADLPDDRGDPFGKLLGGSLKFVKHFGPEGGRDNAATAIDLNALPTVLDELDGGELAKLNGDFEFTADGHRGETPWGFWGRGRRVFATLPIVPCA